MRLRRFNVGSRIRKPPMPELAPTNFLTPNRNSEALRMGGPPIEDDPSTDATSFRLTCCFPKGIERAATVSGSFSMTVTDAPL